MLRDYVCEEPNMESEEPWSRYPTLEMFLPPQKLKYDDKDEYVHEPRGECQIINYMKIYW